MVASNNKIKLNIIDNKLEKISLLTTLSLIKSLKWAQLFTNARDFFLILQLYNKIYFLEENIRNNEDSYFDDIGLNEFNGEEFNDLNEGVDVEINNPEEEEELQLDIYRRIFNIFDDIRTRIEERL